MCLYHIDHKFNCLVFHFLCRIHQLEKDLFYYKKTSRDLKKKLRELLASNPTPTPHHDDGTNHGKIASFIYIAFLLQLIRKCCISS